MENTVSSQDMSLLTPPAPRMETSLLCTTHPTPAPSSEVSVGPEDVERDTVKYLEMVKIDEPVHLPVVDALHHQREIDGPRRRELVDWLMNITTDANLHYDTLFLAMNLTDRYLSHRMVPLQDFQLLGITSLFIASKYNDLPNQALTLHAVINLCRKEYTKADIFEMERRVLHIAQFDLAYKSPAAIAELLLCRKDAWDVQIGESDWFYSPAPGCVAPRRIGNHQAGMASPPSPPGNAAGPILIFESIPRSTLLRAAHAVLLVALHHSRFTGIHSGTMAVASIIAAEGVLREPWTRGRKCESILTDPALASLLPTLSIEPFTQHVAPQILECYLAYHGFGGLGHAQSSTAGGLPTPPPEMQEVLWMEDEACGRAQSLQPTFENSTKMQ
ncbi:cyclin-like protein [Gonapodya prolifera JEL478]|uniref:Cyclin-like protein n=1 Tax=Gonapodya prolifera (strain JEL478) TaxID=1344416 RepID=A0A139AFK0_GONPJ|nr:cyclin-like protein [Gonapodya prolifera JEL478]|eukprot:KXS15538.1 cyclin-like protein [Gonapodya prolifera JEL478]